MRYLVLLMLTASQMAYSFDCNQPQTEYQTIVCQAYEATLIPDHTATHEPILTDSHQITRVDQTTSNQTTSNQTTSNQTTSNQTTSNQTTSNQTTSNQTMIKPEVKTPQPMNHKISNTTSKIPSTSKNPPTTERNTNRIRIY